MASRAELGESEGVWRRDFKLCTRTAFSILSSRYRLKSGSSGAITITDAAPLGQDLKGYFTPEEWSKAERDDISVDQVRQALSTISGSLSEAVIALREE